MATSPLPPVPATLMLSGLALARMTDAGTLLQNSAQLTDAHSIHCDVPRDPVWCLADEAQIRQIVWNLATNGLRAMASGGRLTLCTASDEAAGEVELAVTDEGVGIAPEEIEGIFQPFHGAFTRGAGLGLSIVHRIVSDYGGEIKVTSNKGEGTTLRVRFPADVQAAGDREGRFAAKVQGAH
jgi:signal transduction histidine kinase